jgi:hypothetical protein
MERSIERERNLPCFSLDLDELGILIAKLTEAVEEPDKVRLWISFRLKQEEISFRSVEEISLCKELPKVITNLSDAISRTAQM